MASAYFILPQVGNGTYEDPYRPKYTDQPEVARYDGSEVIEHASGNYYACRVFGDAADLQTLANQNDAHHIDPQAIEDALNASGQLPVDISARNWALLISHFLRSSGGG